MRRTNFSPHKNRLGNLLNGQIPGPTLQERQIQQSRQRDLGIRVSNKCPSDPDAGFIDRTLRNSAWGLRGCQKSTTGGEDIAQRYVCGPLGEQAVSVGVQVSSSEQLPQQNGRLAELLQGFGQTLNPLTPGFLLLGLPLRSPAAHAPALICSPIKAGPPAAGLSMLGSSPLVFSSVSPQSPVAMTQLLLLIVALLVLGHRRPRPAFWPHYWLAGQPRARPGRQEGDRCVWEQGGGQGGWRGSPSAVPDAGLPALLHEVRNLHAPVPGCLPLLLKMFNWFWGWHPCSTIKHKLSAVSSCHCFTTPGGGVRGWGGTECERDGGMVGGGNSKCWSTFSLGLSPEKGRPPGLERGLGSDLLPAQGGWAGEEEESPGAGKEDKNPRHGHRTTESRQEVTWQPWRPDQFTSSLALAGSSGCSQGQSQATQTPADASQPQATEPPRSSPSGRHIWEEQGEERKFTLCRVQATGRVTGASHFPCLWEHLALYQGSVNESDCKR
ncbi:hypothetical protein Cadr_000021305 [Camelus dromedarius]|uniref:Uncharacterized protein n=1 Tax=Camelus dromedarius TaxID=9838 RepID=A0A5N4CUN3_CAMDR|nr:hypothetical protein Cadr_000021305 [Camelus dromedarius]